MSSQRFCGALGLSILLLAGPLTGRAGADPIPSDFDDDGDVDLADFAEFQACLLGSAVPQTNPLCTDAHLDTDLDVDLDDFEVFQGCLSGPDNPADPNCACAPWQTNCGGACVDLMNDPFNCGACWNQCSQTDVCAGGTCQGQCSGCEAGPGADPIPSDFNDDGDVDLADFAEFEPCMLGSAVPQTDPLCTGARLDADDDVDLDDFAIFQGCLSGPDNPAEPNCGCPSGQTNCDGTCVNTASDNANCGACANVCAAGTTCVSGSCELICPPGTTLCGGECIDTLSNAQNCGGCGQACPVGHVYYVGSCCNPTISCCLDPCEGP